MDFMSEFQKLATVMSNDMQVLVALMVIDFVTGVIKGTKGHKLSSAIMNQGIRKKSAFLIGILFALVLDVAMFDKTPTFTTIMTFLAISNEGLSITENLAQLGVPIPSVITKRLQAMKDVDK